MCGGFFQGLLKRFTSRLTNAMFQPITSQALSRTYEYYYERRQTGMASKDRPTSR
jgi:hypothetical protein